MTKQTIGISLLILLFAQMTFAEQRAISLGELLKRVYENNSVIESYKRSWEAEDSLVISKYTLEDPKIGFSELNRGAKTQYGTISQRFKFPVKYNLAGKAQKSRAKYQKTQFEFIKLKVRYKVISLYYSIYSMQKIIQLTRANMDAIKEFSRVAEKKYAAGKAPQSDQMKAHFELTNLEIDLIRLRQKEQSLQDEMRAALYDPSYTRINLEKMELPVPRFEKSKVLSPSITELTEKLKTKSVRLRSEMNLLEEAEYKSSLAKWNFVPDVEFKYQQRISGNPTDSHIYSVNFTIPLWFWKKSSEASSAIEKLQAQESFVHHTLHKMIAKVRGLSGKVESSFKTINIYKTTLIPQAEGAYNSSRGAYRASKTSFLDLLDSERALYRVKTGFYKSLRQYVEHLSQLETELGFPVSELGQEK